MTSRLILLAGAAAASAFVAGCAATTSSPATRLDRMTLGRNNAGDPCVATRTWSDAAAPDEFSRSFYLTCRNVAASRPLGAIRLVADTPAGLAPIDAALDCGPEAAVTVAGRAATGRRCFDRVLGTDTIRFDVPLAGERLVADAAPSLLGPLEEGIAIVLGRKPAIADPGRDAPASVDLASIPARTGGATAAAGTAFDPQLALAQGIALNRRGLHVDASRTLNDALSRLPADASPAIRAELLLEAGLADSNISFQQSADEHFAQADAIVARDPAAATTFLRRKRNTYQALDLLNRRRFRPALTALEQLVSAQVAADQPLMDLATVRRLNQPLSRTDTASAVAVPDTSELSQVVLDVQANWARSVALFSLGDVRGATAALDASARAYDVLQRERIEQAQVLWLGARVERQRGRLAAHAKNWTEAVAAFDRGLDLLRRGALAASGTGNEPAIAEAELERASVFAQSGAGRDAIRDQYAKAVDALIASSNTAGGLPSGMDGYLDVLVAEAEAGARPDTFERFFRAMQAAGEPAVARQVSQLQNVVTSDPALGAKVRDRAELEREITRLRYAIAAADRGAPAAVQALEAQRQAAEAKLLAVDASLGSDNRYRSLDDRPATIAEVRAALRPGEAFLKVAELNRRAYGLFIDGERSVVYSIAGSAKELAALEQLGDRVRASIDGRLGEGKLVPFDAAGAHALFRLIAGPAREHLLAAKSLVVDPAGPLETLPIATLVAQYDPAERGADAFDFSRTDFLATRMTISTALSPRSFLVARALPASNARNAFLGLGEHQPASAATVRPASVSVGFGCSVPFAELASLSRQVQPISASELRVAADALGQPQSPMMTNAAFSDTAIEARGDLGDFQVLHFATHGLEEGQWGCPKSPPALVTSFGEGDSDGLLSFSEIARLRLDANLVVLSACETASGVKDQGLARASGQEEAGSTLEGLVRAFLTANARSVLATYWQVSAEQESEDFIRAFYSAARTRTMGEALQTAQAELIGRPRFSHPFYWAPYFLVGDSTKPMLSRPTRTAAR